MNKKSFKLLLMSFLALTMISCEKPTDSASSSNTLTPSDSVQEEQVELPKFALDFIENVNKIQSVTLTSRDQLDLCIMLYRGVDSTLLNDERVVAAKTTLDGYIETYNHLKSEYESTQENQALVLDFLNKMTEVVDVDYFTLDDYESVLSAQKSYEKLTEELQNREDVQTEKAKLDALFDKYEVISSMNAEEYQAYKFVSSVSILPAIDDVTFTNIELVDDAFALYDSLSLSNKNAEDVKTAYAKLNTYMSRSNEIKASLQKAEDFMKLSFSLPPSGALKYQDAAQKASIDKVFEAYDKLTEEEKQISGVEEAYLELVAVKNAFDSLLEPYDIASIACGWNFQQERLVFTAGKDPISILMTKYGYKESEIKDNVIVYLDLYYEAGAVVGSMLHSINITENVNVSLQNIKDILIQLRAEGNAKAISGDGYCFTIHIESLNDTYASSSYTGLFGGQKITF